MLDTRLGERVGIWTSNLVPSKSAKGEPIVRLDRNQDNVDATYDAALVVRDNAKSDWRAVKDVKELQGWLDKASAQDKRDNLGLWRDRRMFFIVGPRDGKIQKREVQTMDDFWAGKFTLNSRRYEMDPKRHCEADNAAYYAKCDPGGIFIDNSPGKVNVFTEPEVISDCYMEQIKSWQQDGTNWVPCESKYSEYHLFH